MLGDDCYSRSVWCYQERISTIDMKYYETVREVMQKSKMVQVRLPYPKPTAPT